MNGDSAVAARLAKFRRLSLLAALFGAAMCAIEAYFRPDRFFPAYLAAWLFWWSISSGSLAIAMIHHLSGGAWGLAIRRILEAAFELMPLLAILFVPVLMGLPRLYVWAQPEHVSADAMLQAKRWYLNESGFVTRAVGYF